MSYLGQMALTLTLSHVVGEGEERSGDFSRPCCRTSD